MPKMTLEEVQRAYGFGIALGKGGYQEAKNAALLNVAEVAYQRGLEDAQRKKEETK